VRRWTWFPLSGIPDADGLGDLGVKNWPDYSGVSKRFAKRFDDGRLLPPSPELKPVEALR
jgi:hypothetical protein